MRYVSLCLRDESRRYDYGSGYLCYRRIPISQFRLNISNFLLHISTFLKLYAVQEIWEETTLEYFVDFIRLAVVTAHEYVFLIGQILEIEVEAVR